MDSRYTIPQTGARGVTYDAGLRAHMQRVYGRMTAGVLVTALTAWIVSSSPMLLQLFLGGPQMYLVMFAPLAVLWFGFRPERMASRQLSLAFFAIAALYGISFSVIAVVFTGESIARAFFVATAMFAGLSAVGYTTRKNLDGLGTFAIMGVMGVFFASIGTMIAGAFGVETTMMQNIIAAVGIIAFAGLTAWQTQNTKEMFNASYGDEMNSRMAWAATLNLYISFIAMFQYLMHFMGQQRS
jgi:FtsH-binding integral membrane protein